MGPCITVLAAALAITKVATTALSSCHYSHTRTIESYCTGFCQEMMLVQQTASILSVAVTDCSTQRFFVQLRIHDASLDHQTREERDAAQHRRAQAERWASDLFGFVSCDHEAVTAGARGDTPAAEDGRFSAQKRKNDFDGTIQVLNAQKIRALGG